MDPHWETLVKREVNLNIDVIKCEPNECNGEYSGNKDMISSITDGHHSISDTDWNKKIADGTFIKQEIKHETTEAVSIGDNNTPLLASGGEHESQTYIQGTSDNLCSEIGLLFPTGGNRINPSRRSQRAKKPLKIQDIHRCSQDCNEPKRVVIIFPSKDSQQLDYRDISAPKHYCLFCKNDSKKVKGVFQKLRNLDKVKFKRKIKPFYHVVVNTEIYNKLQEADILKAHPACKIQYINKLPSLQEQSQSNDHKKIEYCRKGFDIVCEYIEENVIAKSKCYYLSVLFDYYIDAIKSVAEKDGFIYNTRLSIVKFKNELKAKYCDQIKVSVWRRKNVIGPFNLDINDVCLSSVA